MPGNEICCAPTSRRWAINLSRLRAVFICFHAALFLTMWPLPGACCSDVFSLCQGVVLGPQDIFVLPIVWKIRRLPMPWMVSARLRKKRAYRNTPVLEPEEDGMTDALASII